MKIKDITIFATMEDGSLHRVMLDASLGNQILHIISSATNNQITIYSTIYNPSTFNGKSLVIHEGVPVNLIAPLLNAYLDDHEGKIGFRHGVAMLHNDTFYYVYETKTTIVFMEG